MGFLTILLMNKLNISLKMLTNKINTVPLRPVNKHISNIFTATKCTTIINQMKKIFNILIQRNILTTDFNKKIKLIIYYNKFKSSNFVIKYNSSSSMGVLQKKPTLYINSNVFSEIVSPKTKYVYQFNLIYSIEKSYNAPFWYKFHTTAFKNYTCPTTELRKILTGNTAILEQQNNKQKL